MIDDTGLQVDSAIIQTHGLALAKAGSHRVVFLSLAFAEKPLEFAQALRGVCQAGTSLFIALLKRPGEEISQYSPAIFSGIDILLTYPLKRIEISAVAGMATETTLWNSASPAMTRKAAQPQASVAA